MKLKASIKKPEVQTLLIGMGITSFFAFLTAFRSPPGLKESLAHSNDYLQNLHPELRKRAIKFIKRAYAAGLPITITSGYRSHEEQDRLYAQGRTLPGIIVTKAKPGFSWHNHRLAFDIAKYENQIISWPEDPPFWIKLGEIGRKLGLEHGRRFGDNPHFDYHPNLTIAQAAAGQTLA